MSGLKTRFDEDMELMSKINNTVLNHPNFISTIKLDITWSYDRPLHKRLKKIK